MELPALGQQTAETHLYNTMLERLMLFRHNAPNDVWILMEQQTCSKRQRQEIVKCVFGPALIGSGTIVRMPFAAADSPTVPIKNVILPKKLEHKNNMRPSCLNISEAMNSSSNPFVSVIIPVCDDLRRLKICLEALENQTYPTHSYEVLVVNNNTAKDIEPDIVSFNHVRVICERRRGSYAARNKGILNARGTVLAFTDSDCIPREDWIEKGVKNLLSRHNMGLVAGRIDIIVADPDKPTAIEIYEKITAFQQKFYIEHSKFGATANLFTFKNIVEDVGNFDDSLMSSGDVEWCNRVFAAGHTQMYADDTCILHPARKTFSEKFRKSVRIIKGKHALGLLDCSSRTFMKRLIWPVMEAGDILSKGKHSAHLKGKKQKLKFIVALFFDSYVWAFGSLVVAVFGRTGRKKLKIH